MENKNENVICQYTEPYHHYVSFDKCIVFKESGAGFEYLSYVNDVINEVQETKPRNLLDFGCGDGKFLYEYQKKDKDCKLFGVDMNSNAIKFANNMTNNINFYDENIFNIKFDKKFDCIVSIQVFEHIEMELSLKIIEHLKSLLSDNGRLIICLPSDNREVQKEHYRHYNETNLENQFQSLSNVKTYYSHKMCFFEKVFRNLIQNKYFLIKSGKYYYFIYKIYKKIIKNPNESNGAHIIGVFKK